MSGDDWLGDEQPKSKVEFKFYVKIYFISTISHEENPKAQLIY